MLPSGGGTGGVGIRPAALNHPNIAVIHGLEVWGDTRVLVLELVDGVTLADRLIKGPLSVNEALTLALQIADSVEAENLSSTTQVSVVMNFLERIVNVSQR